MAKPKAMTRGRMKRALELVDRSERQRIEANPSIAGKEVEALRRRQRDQRGAVLRAFFNEDAEDRRGD